MSQHFDPNPYQVTASAEYSAALGPASVAKRHSLVGIVSSVLAFLNCGIFVLIIGYSIYLTAGGEPLESSDAVIIGFLTIGMLVLLLIGVCLGVVGLILPGRKKLFSILGLCVNGLVLFAIVGLMVVGMMVS